jgi:ribosomal protein S18 acetylase RimI-like enzyme
MSEGATFSYEPFKATHLEGVVSLCAALDWPSYLDPSTTLRALSAPGSVTFVACRGDQVVGLAHLLSDHVIQAHLSLIGVLPDYRRRGVARRLLGKAFAAAGCKWLDLSAEPGSEPFYRSFLNKEGTAFRLYLGERKRGQATF